MKKPRFFLFILNMLIIFICISSAKSVRLLIARPNNFGYEVDEKAKWIGPIVESYFYFRLDAIDNVQIISFDKITAKNPVHRDFSKRISRGKYQSIAKELGATHLLYSEYEMKSSKDVKLYLNIEPLKNSGQIKKIESIITLGSMNSSLLSATNDVASAIGINSQNLPSEFFELNILGKKEKNVKKLGGILSAERTGSKASYNTIGMNCKKISDSDPMMFLAYFAGSRFYLLGGKNKKALKIMDDLVKQLGFKYPKLNLTHASFYRKSRQLLNAQSAVERVNSSGPLRSAVLLEKGLIFEAKGNMASARDNFITLKGLDASNPDIFLHLAKIALATKNNGELVRYMREATALYGKSSGDIYYDMAFDFAENNDANNALLAYSKSVESDPKLTKAWLAAGELQETQALHKEAANSYLQVYLLDYVKYPDHIIKAGDLLETNNMTDIAKQTYEIAYAKSGDPQIAVRIGTIEFNNGDLKKAQEVLRLVTAPYDADPEVIAMLEKCDETYNPRPSTTNTYQSAKPRKPPVLTLKGKSPVHLKAGGRYKEKGASAYDEFDGNISDNIEIAGTVDTKFPGAYTITYSVTNQYGAIATAKRVVNVYGLNAKIDRVPPKIKLIGGSPNVIDEGDAYEEPGVNAIDDVDGDVTMYINIEGMVDSERPGSYKIIYSAVDKSGNTAEKILKVTVKSTGRSTSQFSTNYSEDPYAQNTRTTLSGLIKPTRRKSSVRKNHKRKVALGLISGLLGAGFGTMTFIVEKNTIPRLQKEYDNIGFEMDDESEEDIEARDELIAKKRKSLQNSGGVRMLGYISSGVLGFTFFLNFVIPSKKL